jgi:hypothetical protein
MLKRVMLCLVLALIAVPAWPARKLTVDELAGLLRTMQQEKKSDQEVAAALEQVELTEKLNHERMNGFAPYLPGAHSTEQIYVLEARSAALAPPAGELPATPAPAPDAVKAILDKATAYINGPYAQLPPMTATRSTQRFQDQVEPVATQTHPDAPADPNIVGPRQFVHYINVTDYQVTIEHGVEKPPVEKDKTPWGANRMIVIQDQPDLSLNTVLSAAQTAGTIKWLRWEMVEGKPAAVFSFEVPKKKSHYALSICCFPSEFNANGQLFTADVPSVSGADRTSQGATVEWHPYKASGVPYQGQIFIDPDNGTVLRLIVQPEFKASNLVHIADTRIDYGPVTLGSKTEIVPVRTYVSTEVMPYGTQADKDSARCTFFDSEYKNYALVEGASRQK